MKRHEMRVTMVVASVVGAIVLMTSQAVHAGAAAQLNYREINSASGVCWRSWAVMNVTNKAQGICDASNNGIEPPATNAPNYIGSGDELSINSATPPAVGYNGLTWNAVNQARGRVMGVIETTSTQQRQGLYRVFSDYTITGAAYYMDGPQTLLDASSPPVSNCFGAWAVDVVNPAYVIPFDLAPVAAPSYAVTGSVYATAAGGNNQLESGWVLVEWRYANETLWRTGVDTLNASGDFGFVPEVVSNAAIYVRARVKDAYTPRPWFPQSQQYLLNIAYSAPPFIDITNAPMTLAAGTTSAVIGGTNVNVTSPMWWSNTLAAGQTAISFSGNSFSANINNLQIGVNTIWVYGTNVYGVWTNDSVTITVPMPIPFIDITNAPMTVAAGTTSAVIGGTNVNVTSPMWWSNSLAAGQTAISFSGDSFSANINNLQIGVNTIWVYGTNVYGVWTNDSVVITVTSPIPPAAGWLVTNVLASIGQLRDGSRTISNAFRVEDVDAEVCAVQAVEYSLNGSAWQAVAWNQISGATSGLASANILISAPAHVLYWDAQAVFGAVVTGGWLRMQVRNTSGQVSEWAEGVFMYDGVCQNFAITAPNGGMNFSTNSGAGVAWPISGTIEMNATRVRVYNLLTGGMSQDTTVGPAWDVSVVMGNGTNTLVAVGEDYYGNEARATQTIVIADTAWPYVDIVDPAGSEAVVAAGQSYYTIVSTNANVSAVRAIVNGQVAPYVAAVNPYNFTVALAEGTNVITVEGTNALASAQDTVVIIRPALVVNPGDPYVEIIEPAATVVAVPAGQSSYDIESTNANVVAIGTVINGVMTLQAAVNPYNFTVALAEGINTITVIGTNAAGAVAQDSVTIIRPVAPPVAGAPYVDIIEPAVAVTHVAANQTTYAVQSTNANVVALAVEINGGGEVGVPLVNPYNFTVALAEGINTITVSGTNAAGVRAEDSVTIVRAAVGPPQPGAPYVDIIDPAVVVTQVAAEQVTYNIQSTNAHVVAIGTVLNGVTVLQPAVNPYNFEIALAEGINTITVLGTNAAGVVAQDSVTIIRPRVIVNPGDAYVEIVNPVAVITHVPASQASYVVQSTNANVAAVGFITNGVQHMVSAVNPYNVQMALGIGVNTITIVGTNTAGQVAEDSATIVRGGGGQAPVIVDIQPPTGYVSSTNVVGMTITVNDDLGQALVRVNGAAAAGTYPVYTYQLALGAEGQWIEAVVIATDNEGVAATQTVQYTWTTSANRPPMVYILQPGRDGTVVPTNYIPVFGTAQDSDGTVVRVELNGVVVNAPYYPWYVASYGALQVGTNVLEALAIDNSGATGRATRIVLYAGLAGPDTTPPVVVIEQPINWYQATHSPMVVSGWATDDYAVASVEVNGVVVAPPGYPGAWERTVGLVMGTNMIVAKATDYAGNAGYATAMVVYVPGVDTNAPSVWITSHYNHQVVQVAEQVIAGSSSDGTGGSGVTSVYVNAVRAIGVAPYARPVTLQYGMNVVTAIAVDGAGNTSAPASVVIYYLTNGLPLAAINITTPYGAETNVAVVGFGGMYGINEIAIPGAIEARVNGNVVWTGATAAGPVYAPWSAGAITLQLGTNVLEAVLTLTSGYSVTARHEITYVPASTGPEIMITHPQAGTSQFTEVAFFGSYRLYCATTATVRAWVNGNPMLVQATPAGPAQRMWHAGSVTLQVGMNVLSARVVCATGEAADDSVAVFVCTNCACTAVPDVRIVEPSHGVTNAGQVRFYGTYHLDGGVMEYLTGYVNGVGVQLNMYTTNTWDGGTVNLVLGLNRFEVILRLRCGIAATARWDVVYTMEDPFVQITFPTLEPVWVAREAQMNIGGVYFCATSTPVSVTWRNEANGTAGTTVWSSGFWNAHGVPLAPCTNNLFIVTLRNAYGHEVEDTLVITVPCSNDMLEVICNWPRYVGIGQTGLVEFVSPEGGVPYRIYWGATNENRVIGAGVVGNNDMIGTRFYHCATFRVDDVSLIMNGRGMSNDLWVVVAGNTNYVAKAPRLMYAVPDMKVNNKATPNQDVDGDLFVVSYKGSPASVVQVIGRTIILSNVTPKDALAVKVSQEQNGGDGVVVLAMLIVQAGDMKGVKWSGDIDDIIVSGSLQRVAISAGTLGYRYDARSRYYHGYVATGVQPGERSGAKQVTVKAKKAKINEQTVVLGGNIEGDVRLDRSYQGKGVALAAGNGSIMAHIVVDAVKGLVAKGKVPAGVISNSLVLASGEIAGKGISIGKLQARSIEDTVIAGARDIKSVQAASITDSSRQLQGNETNHPRRAAQIIAGWWQSPLDKPFRPWLVASNGYEGVIVSGVVQRVSAKTVHEGVQVTSLGEKGVKKPSSKVTQTNAVWWVDGKRAPENWDGKTPL